MKRILTILFVTFTVLCSVTAQIRCVVDGPANVRKSASSKSAIMGRIANNMIAEVSHVGGDWYRIHRVYNPNGGSSYTGSVIGYYTHRQNLKSATSPRTTTTYSVVGTWACHVRRNEVVSIQFNQNGTYRLLHTNAQGKWSRKGNKIYAHEYNSPQVWVLEILSLDNYSLVVKDQSQNATLYFDKVK